MLLEKIAQRTIHLLDPRYRDFYRQRRVTDIPTREERTRQLAKELPAATECTDPRIDEKYATLARDGYVMLDEPVRKPWVGDLHAYFSSSPCADPYRKLPAFVGPENAPAGTHVAFFDNNVVAKAPHAFEIANDPTTLAIVAKHLGAKPTISYMTAWWSVPAKDGVAQHAEKFHRDVDDFKFIKLFCYLTDVDDECGPHVFIRGTPDKNKLTKIRRYSDEEVYEAFGKENEIRFTGPAGTCFLEDTYGMHRGFPPRSKPRLIFQVLYSLRPVIYGPTSPILQLNGDGMPADLDTYTNRIYCA